MHRGVPHTHTQNTLSLTHKLGAAQVDLYGLLMTFGRQSLLKHQVIMRAAHCPCHCTYASSVAYESNLYITCPS